MKKVKFETTKDQVKKVIKHMKKNLIKDIPFTSHIEIDTSRPVPNEMTTILASGYYETTEEIIIRRTIFRKWKA